MGSSPLPHGLGDTLFIPFLHKVLQPSSRVDVSGVPFF